jgi:predicted nucleic acid-binding protein
LSYLLDTNIISELRKRTRAHPGVSLWWQSTPLNEMFTSVLVLGEIRLGVELAKRRNDPVQARALEDWHQQMLAIFRPRLLIVDHLVAQCWGRIRGDRPLPPIDALLAATALVHDLTLVTRNTRDIASTGVRLLDPFADA